MCNCQKRHIGSLLIICVNVCITLYVVVFYLGREAVPSPLRTTSQCQSIRGWERYLIQGAGSIAALLNDTEQNMTWPNFSPSMLDLAREPTDLADFTPLFGRLADMPRAARHVFNFVLNPEMQRTVPNDAIPLLLRVYKRTHPLDTVLDSLCAMRPPTLLIVSIDGDLFVDILHLLVQKLRTCIFTRIVWHSYADDCRDFKLTSCHAEDPNRLNAHFWSVHFLAMVRLGFPYAVTLEDDLFMFPDFYSYHYNMRPYALSDARVTAVSASPTGALHDCVYLRDKASPHALCGSYDSAAVFTDRYYSGWGSAIPQRTFATLYPLWRKVNMPYDVFINEYVHIPHEDLIVIHPCAPRIKYLPNVGTNGAGKRRWEYDVYRNESRAPETFRFLT